MAAKKSTPSDQLPQDQAPPETGKAVVTEQLANQATEQDEAPAVKEPVALESINADNWSDTVKLIGVSGMSRQLADNCVLNTREGERLNLQIESAQAHLNTAQFSARLQTALSEYTRRNVSIEIEQSDAKLNTPARIDAKNTADALVAARAAIDADPVVKQLLSSVDGVVDAKSVQPVDASDGAPVESDKAN